MDFLLLMLVAVACCWFLVAAALSKINPVSATKNILRLLLLRYSQCCNTIIKKKMGRMVYVLTALVLVTFYSCNNSGGSNDKNSIKSTLADNAVMQQQDGTISLDVEQADTYHDINNPQSNTAEWNVVVSKKGRYDVWLASATKDTTRLKYKNQVMLNILDNQLEAQPSIDKVIQNSSDVSLPYYRAESFIGSLFIPDTGVVNIQIISDRIMPAGDSDFTDDIKLLSVSLTPSE